MPDLYLGIGVSDVDCDALASHARNRLQSDRDDRCQDSRRPFPFVAAAAANRRLPLPPTACGTQKRARRPLGRPTRPLIRESGSGARRAVRRILLGESDRAPRAERRDRLVARLSENPEVMGPTTPIRRR